MFVLERYLLKELMPPFVFALVLLGAFMSTGFVLFQLMEEMVRFSIPLAVVTKIFVLRLPEMLFYTLPMSLLLGSMLAFSRLSVDHEILAFRLLGVSYLRLLLPPLGFAMSVVCFTIISNETFIPPSVFAAREALHLVQTQGVKLAEKKSHFQYRFNVSANEYYLFYAQEADPERLSQVSVQYWKGHHLNSLLQAESAEWDGNSWIFSQGKNTVFNPQEELTSTFLRFILPVQTNFKALLKEQRRPLEMNLRELGAYIHALSQGGEKANALSVRWHHKLSIPFSGLFFVWVGCLLGSHAHPGKSQSFGMSLLLIFVYYLFMAIGTAMGDSGSLSAVYAAWLPNLVLGLGGMGLFYYKEHRGL